MKSPLIINELDWKNWTSHVEALPIVGSVSITPISYPCICVLLSNTIGTAIEIIYANDFNVTNELAKAKEALKSYQEDKQSKSNGVTPPASGS